MPVASQDGLAVFGESDDLSPTRGGTRDIRADPRLPAPVMADIQAYVKYVPLLQERERCRRRRLLRTLHAGFYRRLSFRATDGFGLKEE